jgi:hypothetical protein
VPRISFGEVLELAVERSESPLVFFRGAFPRISQA